MYVFADNMIKYTIDPKNSAIEHLYLINTFIKKSWISNEFTKTFGLT